MRTPSYPVKHSVMFGPEETKRVGALRTSENSPSETVWKIGMVAESILRGTPRGDEGGFIGRFLSPKTHTREASGYFPNSFSTHSGEYPQRGYHPSSSSFTARPV